VPLLVERYVRLRLETADDALPAARDVA